MHIFRNKNIINPSGDHYCVNEGDVIGLSYGEYDDPRPAFHNFNEICNPITINKITSQATPNNKAFQTQTFLQNYAIPILLGVFLLFLIIAIIYIVSIL